MASSVVEVRHSNKYNNIYDEDIDENEGQVIYKERYDQAER